MVLWNEYKCCGYHTPSNERKPIFVSIKDADRCNDIGNIKHLSLNRQSKIDEVNELIRGSWGSFSFGLYSCSCWPAASFTAGDVVDCLDYLARDRQLPAEIAGCSTKYLMNGNIWEESLQYFADNICTALRSGGAYNRSKISPEKAQDLTKIYVNALFGDVSETDLRFYGLDIGFSSWFYGVVWDFSYFIYNEKESWIALVMGTSTD